MYQERIKQFQEILKEKKIDCFVVPTSDFHDSEYVGDYFKGRTWLSGFTGSAATLVVTQNQAALWTDGRYFIQAAAELAESGAKLMKMDEPGVPTVDAYLAEQIPQKGRLGFDGRVIPYETGKRWADLTKEKYAELISDLDLVDQIWKDRPALSQEPAFVLEERYSGKSFKQKREELLEAMKKAEADVLVESSLDSIAWLLNIRGNDVADSPVVLAYLMVTEKETILYMDEKKADRSVRQYFKENGIAVKDYFAVYEEGAALSERRVWIDGKKSNYALFSAVSVHNEIVNRRSPLTLAKAIKNPVELENLRKAHIRDGAALTRFMYWLKKNIGKTPISEVSAQDYLLKLRKEQELFIEPSFETIAAYKDHAAMMHYSADEKSSVDLKPEGMLLVDSGGQYFDGTTDVTRTFVLGPISEKEKRDFTLTLKGMLNLSRQKFLYGCGGVNLDILARSALWNQGIDYKCGTGHGVGFLLNVHEGPHGCRWRKTADGSERETLQEGMILTDEPGVYVEGEYGIRLENQLAVRKDIENEYGQFMKFQTLTCAPLDLDGVEVTMLSKEERDEVNAYHSAVYESLAPLLSQEEAIWLKQATRPV